MENFQDRGIRIRFVLRGWIRIRSISDRIRHPGPCIPFRLQQLLCAFVTSLSLFIFLSAYFVLCVCVCVGVLKKISKIVFFPIPFYLRKFSSFLRTTPWKSWTWKSFYWKRRTTNCEQTLVMNFFWDWKRFSWFCLADIKLPSGYSHLYWETPTVYSGR